MVVGNDIIEIEPSQGFSIHFPWRRGQPNIHKGIGGSLTAVMADMEHIWSWCVTQKLEIPLKDLKVTALSASL